MIVNIDESPDVVAVVVTLGTKTARLIKCIETINEQQTSLKIAIICVINNAIFDMNIFDKYKVTTVVAGVNLGFAGALTFARQFITAPNLWIIQDDMLLDKRCLEALYSKLNSDERMAVVTPYILTENGMVAEKSCGGLVDDHGTITEWLPHKDLPLDKIKNMNTPSYVPSRGMLVKMKYWDLVTGVDPNYYPVLWTDVDFCTALKRQNLKIALAELAFAEHEGKGSTPTMINEFLYHRNKEIFSTKWFNEKNTTPNSQKSEWPIHEKISLELLKLTAKNASDAFLELGRRYSSEIILHREKLRLLGLQVKPHNPNVHDEIKFLSEQLADTMQVLENTCNSLSWKITAPLRKINAIVKSYLKAS